MDHLSRRQRSALMSKVRNKDSTAELAVRSAAHMLGYRFRLHRRDLPGTPDLVFPQLRKIIFVNGCFRHRHDCTRGKQQPQTNAAFWAFKLKANAERDATNLKALRNEGWRPFVVWECE